VAQNDELKHHYEMKEIEISELKVELQTVKKETQTRVCIPQTADPGQMEDWSRQIIKGHEKELNSLRI
jgi:hypothetical protein